jgi:hypothetical protein
MKHLAVPAASFVPERFMPLNKECCKTSAGTLHRTRESNNTTADNDYFRSHLDYPLILCITKVKYFGK